MNSLQEAKNEVCTARTKLHETINNLSNQDTILNLSDLKLHCLRGFALGEAFKRIPYSVHYLNLSANNLGYKNTEKLIYAFINIPASVKHIDLSYNELQQKSCEELVQILLALPNHITHINLSGNDLYLLNSRLEQVFSALPPSVKSINLSNNYFGVYSSLTELTQALSALPSSIQKLNLSHNFFGSRIAPELKRILQSLPASITSLDLSANDFYIQGYRLDIALNGMPNSITSLNLSNNVFKKNFYCLKRAIKALPSSISLIDLSGNNLGNLSQNLLFQLLESIPETVTSLKLSNNAFNKKTEQELEQIIQRIPIWVREKIDFSCNDDFTDMPLNKILTLLQSISHAIKNLNFSNNDLGRKDKQYLIQIFTNIPVTINSIDLSNNEFLIKNLEDNLNLDKKLTIEDLKEILNAIPEHININFSNNKLFKCSPGTRDEILKFIRDIPRTGRIDLSDNGETDFERALGPIMYSGVNQQSIRANTALHILSFLNPKKADQLEKINEANNLKSYSH